MHCIAGSVTGSETKLVSGVSNAVSSCLSERQRSSARTGGMEPGMVRKDRAPHGDPGWRSCLCPQSNLWVGIRKLSVRCWEHGYRVEVYVPAWDRKAASGRASGLPVQAGSRCGSARTKAVESRGRESVLSGCQSPVLPRRGPDHAVHPEGQRIHIPLGGCESSRMGVRTAEWDCPCLNASSGVGAIALTAQKCCCGSCVSRRGV